MRNRTRWNPDWATGAGRASVGLPRNRPMPESRVGFEGLEQKGKERRPLGQILVDAGAIDPQLLERALHEQATEGEHRLLGEVLASRGWVDQDVLTGALERQAAESAASRAEAPLGV